MVKPSDNDVSALRAKVDALIARGPREVAIGGPFNRYLDWPTFVLAVFGAVVAICAAGAALYPLGLHSYKFYFGG